MGKDLLECSDGFLIDPNSAHKPTQKLQKRNGQNRKKKDSKHSTNVEKAPNTTPQMTFASTVPQANNTFNNFSGNTHGPNLLFAPTTLPSQNPFSIIHPISLASLHYQIHSISNLLFTPPSQTRITPAYTYSSTTSVYSMESAKYRVAFWSITTCIRDCSSSTQH